MNFEVLAHMADVMAVGAAAWKVVNAMNRLSSVLHDYPPHRHEPGGIISYPYDYPPTPPGQINVNGKVNGKADFPHIT